MDRPCSFLSPLPALLLLVEGLLGLGSAGIVQAVAELRATGSELPPPLLLLLLLVLLLLLLLLLLKLPQPPLELLQAFDLELLQIRFLLRCRRWPSSPAVLPLGGGWTGWLSGWLAGWLSVCV